MHFQRLAHKQTMHPREQTIFALSSGRRSESKRFEFLQVNWLPAPEGPFNLTMRLHAEVLTGKWNPPPITKS